MVQGRVFHEGGNGMNENAGQFRSAAFGGFHRQDVLDYLERVTREHQAKTEELTHVLDQEKTARASAEEENQTLRTQLDEAIKARDTLEEELAQAKQRLEEVTTSLTQAEERVTELSQRVGALEPGAESWQRLKDTAGDIEISAHERAQITVQAARAQAVQLRAEGVRWVLEIQDRCDRLKRELRTAITAAQRELDGVQTSFVQAQEDMESIQSALSDLVACAGDGAREEA